MTTAGEAGEELYDEVPEQVKQQVRTRTYVHTVCSAGCLVLWYLGDLAHKGRSRDLKRRVPSLGGGYFLVGPLEP